MKDHYELYERYRKLRAELSKTNKGPVFDALVLAGITNVHVEFDGEGDSGQIHGLTAFSGEDPAPLPDTVVSIQRATYDTSEPCPRQTPLSEAIEELCYDYLAEEHQGWENNKGAYGEFRFDVENRRVELALHGRFVDVVTHTHTF